jgi:hypothetical protein
MIMLFKFIAIFIILSAIAVLLAHWMFKVLGSDYKDED